MEENTHRTADDYLRKASKVDPEARGLIETSMWTKYLVPLLEKVHFSQLEAAQRALAADKTGVAQECFGAAKFALQLVRKVQVDAGKPVSVEPKWDVKKIPPKFRDEKKKK